MFDDFVDVMNYLNKQVKVDRSHEYLEREHLATFGGFFLVMLDLDEVNAGDLPKELNRCRDNHGNQTFEDGNLHLPPADLVGDDSFLAVVFGIYTDQIIFILWLQICAILSRILRVNIFVIIVNIIFAISEAGVQQILSTGSVSHLRMDQDII